MGAGPLTLLGLSGAVVWAAEVAPPTAASAASVESAQAPASLTDPASTAFVQHLFRDWYAPRAGQFAVSAQALQQTTQRYCRGTAKGERALSPARQAWVRAMTDWTAFSAVSLGPLLSRNSVVKVDFRSLKVTALQKVLNNPPRSGAWDMSRVGAQARGLQAIEWLLWTHPAVAATPDCQYLMAMTSDVADEARGLDVDFTALASSAQNDAQSAAWMNEFFNQWLGGLMSLRWFELELPVSSWGLAQAPRMSSGQTALAWRTRWQALKALTVPEHGDNSTTATLTQYLEARGLTRAAAALAQDAQRADQAMATLDPAQSTETLLAAAKQLDAVSHSITREVTDALEIQWQFSAHDGD